MRLSSPGLIVAGLWALGLSSSAQTAPESYSDYDPAGAGQVSLVAWREHDWRGMLARNDTDHDGRITKAEFVAAYCARIEADIRRAVPRCAGDIAVWFSALDLNHDGRLSRAENDRLSTNLFRQNDRNHDGFVTRQEMQDTADGR